MALRVGPRGLLAEVVAARLAASRRPGQAALPRLGGYHGDEQPAQNWSGQGESDCLIKTSIARAGNGVDAM